VDETKLEAGPRNRGYVCTVGYALTRAEETAASPGPMGIMDGQQSGTWMVKTPLFWRTVSRARFALSAFQNGPLLLRRLGSLSH